MFSSNIKMEFGTNKCTVLIMKRGKYLRNDSIKLPNEEQIRALEKSEDYKYLGILEVDDIRHKKTKIIYSWEYMNRLWKILKSKLNAGNTVPPINSRVAFRIQYAAAVVNWRKDCNTRNPVTIHRTTYPQGDVGRLTCCVIMYRGPTRHFEAQGSNGNIRAQSWLF